jgi:hypothetical protein
MPAKVLFEPDDPDELLRGWLLHAHKGRDRHDLAARRCDQRRYWLGIPATMASAIVGTSTFTALQASAEETVKLGVGALALLAAILVALQTFLDLGARAERHRVTGVRYKVMIRQLEQLGIKVLQPQVDSAKLTELRQRLDALEEETPVVPMATYEAVEAMYGEPIWVDSLARCGTHQ